MTPMAAMLKESVMGIFKREPENLYRAPGTIPEMSDPEIQKARLKNDTARMKEADEAAAAGDAEQRDMLRRMIGD